MADDSASNLVGKALLGGAVGFALFFVVTGLGGRAGQDGRGRAGQDGRGRAGQDGGVALTLPPQRPPVRPKDDSRLAFVMMAPTVPRNPMGFRLLGGDVSKLYSVKELIDRVKEGGRTDVELRVSGAVIHRSWIEARQLIEQGGLKVFLAETSPGPSVSGNGPPNVFAPGQLGRGGNPYNLLAGSSRRYYGRGSR